MSKSTEKVMKWQLLSLISLFVLIGAAEGVFLCKHKDQKPDDDNNEDSSDPGTKRNAEENVFFDGDTRRKLDDEYYEYGSRRKESPEDKILRAMLEEDKGSDYGSYRSENEREDYSVMGLRADMFDENNLRSNKFADSARNEETADYENGLARNDKDESYRRAEDQVGRLDDDYYNY